MSREVVTGEDVQAVPKGGELRVGPGAVITPWAQEMATTRGVRITVGGAASEMMTVALGADHGGFPLKEEIKKFLGRRGYRLRDVGCFSKDPVDYPDIALAVARAVKSGEAQLGILVDGAGLGSAMAANKVPGVRAAPCTDVDSARNAREHNDANVLTLGSRFVDASKAEAIVDTFLTTRMTEERHARRVGKIVGIEKEYSK